MIERVTIIGMGLIGSSLAWRARRAHLAKQVVAADMSEDVCVTVRELGMAHVVTSDIGQSVAGSDLVLICVPVGAFDDVMRMIAPHLKEGAVISDVGSVKQSVIRQVVPHLPPYAHFVPAHPIAGTEHSGPRAGFAELFEGRWCILTPLPHTDLRAVETVTKFWEGCGAFIEIMDSQHHDLILGITSHLPHLIAYTIVGTADQLGDDIKSEVIKFSASGFRDFTRIAASDPTMWRDVFLNNKEAVLEILQRFTEDLTAMQKAIRQGDGQFLFDRFTRTRHIRREIIERGQADYKAPSGVKRQDVPPIS